MKRILSLFIISAFLATPAFSDGTAPAAYDYTKCASAATADFNHCKSRSKRVKAEKAKCEAITDETKKTDCLKQLEEKSAKKS